MADASIDRRLLSRHRPVRFEGVDCDNPLAFRYYDKDRVVLGKRMEDHLRSAVCYWHTFCWDGTDIFGARHVRAPLAGRPNDRASRARQDGRRVRLLRPARRAVLLLPRRRRDGRGGDAEASTPTNFADAVDGLERKQARDGRQAAVGHGQPVLPSALRRRRRDQPRSRRRSLSRRCRCGTCLEATQRLGGANYVLWGGREGYDTLLNTDLKRELDSWAGSCRWSSSTSTRSASRATILIEPKPHEPTKHQYDFDTADACTASSCATGSRTTSRSTSRPTTRRWPATSSSTRSRWPRRSASSARSTSTAAIPQNGWDTDQFHNDPRRPAAGDASHRCRPAGSAPAASTSTPRCAASRIDPVDLFHGHIGGARPAGARAARRRGDDRGRPARCVRRGTLRRLGRRARPGVLRQGRHAGVASPTPRSTR